MTCSEWLKNERVDSPLVFNSAYSHISSPVSFIVKEAEKVQLRASAMA